MPITKQNTKIRKTCMVLGHVILLLDNPNSIVLNECHLSIYCMERNVPSGLSLSDNQ